VISAITGEPREDEQAERHQQVADDRRSAKGKTATDDGKCQTFGDLLVVTDVAAVQR
jgi:hypothetical protein